MIATEHLVGTLSGLDNLEVFRDFLGQQIEADGIVTDHRFRHGRDAAFKGRQQPFPAVHADLVMLCAKLIGNDVGISEFVPGLAANGFKPDGKCVEAGLPFFCQQSDNQR